MSQTPKVINGPAKWKSLPDGHIKARREQCTCPGKAENRMHWMHILINYSDTFTSACGWGWGKVKWAGISCPLGHKSHSGVRHSEKVWGCVKHN